MDLDPHQSSKVCPLDLLLPNDAVEEALAKLVVRSIPPSKSVAVGGNPPPPPPPPPLLLSPMPILPEEREKGHKQKHQSLPQRACI